MCSLTIAASTNTEKDYTKEQHIKYNYLILPFISVTSGSGASFKVVMNISNSIMFHSSRCLLCSFSRVAELSYI